MTSSRGIDDPAEGKIAPKSSIIIATHASSYLPPLVRPDKVLHCVPGKHKRNRERYEADSRDMSRGKELSILKLTRRRPDRFARQSTDKRAAGEFLLIAQFFVSFDVMNLPAITSDVTLFLMVSFASSSRLLLPFVVSFRSHVSHSSTFNRRI